MRFGLRAALVVLGIVSDASAYCRTRTCAAENSPEPCSLDASGCATNSAPLYWARPSVQLWVDPRGSIKQAIDGPTARSVLARALRTWTSVDCGGSSPSIAVDAVELLTPEAIAALGLTVAPSDGGTDPIATGPSVSERRISSLSFVDQDWTSLGTHAIAVTTVSFLMESGRIIGADIEVNSDAYNITADDTAPDFDLASILTHEVGHFWGFADLLEPGPTMYGQYFGGGDLGPRTLSADDVRAICETYPPERFSEPLTGGCSCVIPASPARAGFGAWMALACAALALARQRPRVR